MDEYAAVNLQHLKTLTLSNEGGHAHTQPIFGGRKGCRSRDR